MKARVYIIYYKYVLKYSKKDKLISHHWDMLSKFVLKY